MTDFVSQLEAELLAAAHRRASSRRRRLPRLPLRPVLGMATLAAALVAIFVLAARPAPEPAPPTTPPGAVFSLPVAERAAPCASGEQPTTEPAPQAVVGRIKLLRREAAPGERLPVGMRGEWTRPFETWLPVGAYAPGSERQPLDTAELYVVPTADVRSGPIACGPTQSRGPGACLLFGKPGEPVFTRCFTLAEVEAGRAFTLVDVSRNGARLLGLVPDGAAQVELTNNGALALLPVRENAVQDYIGGLKATDRVRVKLDERKPEVLVLNETDTPGLAAAAGAELREIGIDAAMDASPPPRRSETVVQIARPGAEPLARRVAQLLGGSVEPTLLPYVSGPIEPDVVVRLGRDRMR
jgi:hypothetical protein